MATTTRTDIHRPSVFQTADYTVVGYVDVREESHIWNECASNCKANPLNADLYREQAAAEVARLHAQYKAWFGVAAAPSTCRHCGTNRCAYFAVARHVSGETVAIGHQCSDKIGLPSDEHQWNRLQKRAEGLAAARRRDAILAGLEQTDADLFAALTLGFRIERDVEAVVAEKAAEIGVTSPEAFAAIRKSLFIVSDIATKARQYDFVFRSDAQRNLLLSAARLDKAAGWAKEADARAAARAESNAAAATLPVLTGRVTIAGKFVSTRLQESQFGSVLKGLFVADAGQKVWMSVPTSLLGTGTEVVNLPVTLKVTVEPSKDSGFYFGSRPTVA